MEQAQLAKLRAEMTATMEASLKAHQTALEAALDLPGDRWVLENQGFYLSFDTKDQPHSCGVLGARIFLDVTEAHELAGRIKNGNGRKPLVVRYEAALAHEIDGLAKSIADLQP